MTALASGDGTISMTIAKHPASLEGDGVVDRALGGVAAPLDPITAQNVLALEGEADVAHDRDAGAYEKFDLGDHRLAALELTAWARPPS